MKVAFFDTKPYDTPAFERLGSEKNIRFKFYETKLNELQKSGSTDFADMQEKAIRYADVETARVQPSGDKAFTSPLYKKFGNIGGIITMFTSSLNVAFNNVLQANAGLVNAFRKEGGQAFISQECFIYLKWYKRMKMQN